MRLKDEDAKEAQTTNCPLSEVSRLRTKKPSPVQQRLHLFADEFPIGLGR
jgi:hypothetical protein